VARGEDETGDVMDPQAFAGLERTFL